MNNKPTNTILTAAIDADPDLTEAMRQNTRTCDAAVNSEGRSRTTAGNGSESMQEDEEKTYEGRHWQLSESAVNLEGFDTPTITLKIWLKDGTEALIEIERETYTIEISRFEAEKPMPEGECVTFQKSIGPQLLVSLNHLEEPCNWTEDILHPRRGGSLHADREDYVLSMPAICLADNGANDEDEDEE